MKGKGTVQTLIDIPLTAFNLAGVLVAAHVVNVFLSWLIHFVQHQRVWGFDLYRIHLEGHHSLEKYARTPELRRFWATLSHALWAVLTLLFWMGYYLAFTEWVAFAFIAESVVLMVVVYYLHEEYDNTASWLHRFAWFTRARALHEVHHSHRGDFARSVNYAIGGPLMGLLPDRVLSTFQEVSDARHITADPQPLDAGASVVAEGGTGPAPHLGDDGSRSFESSADTVEEEA